VQVKLLSTESCHLCEQALVLINRACPEAQVEVLDIGESDALIERYGSRIPVLCDGDRELNWPFSLLDVRTFLDHPKT